jgi:hypothetical protein
VLAKRHIFETSSLNIGSIFYCCYLLNDRLHGRQCSRRGSDGKIEIVLLETKFDYDDDDDYNYDNNNTDKDAFNVSKIFKTEQTLV